MQTIEKEQMQEKQPVQKQKLSILDLINLCIGFLGIQFAWSMQIGLSGRVTEPLGATPLIFGLIWLAGPITGILVQPVVGVISDNIWTRFGRRRPFLLLGAILGSVGLLAFPNSQLIASSLGVNAVPAIIFAASFLWIIDACVNISQGPYRALVPDIAPPEQQAVANSFLSFAIGLGSVVAYGAAPFIRWAFGYQMSINQQFAMGAVAFISAIIWTCFTTKEKYKPEKTEENTEKALEPVLNFIISALMSILAIGVVGFTFSMLPGAGFSFGEVFSNKDSIVKLLSLFILYLSIPMLLTALTSFKSKDAMKLCAVQFFSWLGLMSMFIYFNNFVVHNIYGVPDLTTATEAVKKSYEALILDATNTSQLAFAIFNGVCWLVSIPLGVFCAKFGKKNIHSIALAIMGIAFAGLGCIAKDATGVLVFMSLAGVGWASILAIPFAMLSEHIPKGTEGSAMGKFNLFIAGPQILSSVAVGYLITSSPMAINGGFTHHWGYAFIVASYSVLVAALLTRFIKEKRTV